MVSLAAAVAAISCLGACGSSSPQSTPPNSVSVTQGSIVVPAHGFVPLSMATTKAGTLNFQLTLTSNIVVAGVVPSSCTTGGSSRSGCSPLNYTEAASTSSSKTLTAPGAAAGSYVIILGNVGPASESVAYQVTLSTS